MKLKAIALVVLAVVIVTIAVVKTISQSPQQRLLELEERERRGTITINERTELAKIKGQSQVILPASLGLDYGLEGQNLNDALSYCSVVIAQPVAERSYIHDANTNIGDITTWYKFKIDESLSEQSKPVSGNIPEELLPREFFPINPNEFLLPQSGGTVLLNGVKVSRHSEYPAFVRSKQYLLFVSIDSMRVANTCGAGTIFSIKADGDLEAVSPESSPVQQELRAKFNNSLNEFRKYLNNRPNMH